MPLIGLLFCEARLLSSSEDPVMPALIRAAVLPQLNTNLVAPFQSSMT